MDRTKDHSATVCKTCPVAVGYEIITTSDRQLKWIETEDWCVQGLRTPFHFTAGMGHCETVKEEDDEKDVDTLGLDLIPFLHLCLFFFRVCSLISLFLWDERPHIFYPGFSMTIIVRMLFPGQHHTLSQE